MASQLLGPDALAGFVGAFVIFVLGFSWGHEHAMWRRASEPRRWARFFKESGWLDVAHCRGCCCVGAAGAVPDVEGGATGSGSGDRVLARDGSVRSS